MPGVGQPLWDSNCGLTSGVRQSIAPARLRNAASRNAMVDCRFRESRFVACNRCSETVWKTCGWVLGTEFATGC